MVNTNSLLAGGNSLYSAVYEVITMMSTFTSCIIKEHINALLIIIQ